jgi:hypothetical protein
MVLAEERPQVKSFTIRLRNEIGFMASSGESALPAPEKKATMFDAFISYSHAIDGTLAAALQQGLHRPLIPDDPGCCPDYER